jgi:aminotransferase
VSAWGKTLSWWADYLLDQAGVALLPGTAFGAQGEGYLRLCFANSMENLQRAVQRIGDAVAELGPLLDR